MSTSNKWDLSAEDIKTAAKDEKVSNVRKVGRCSFDSATERWRGGKLKSESFQELLLEHDSDPDENMLFKWVEWIESLFLSFIVEFYYILMDTFLHFSRPSTSMAETKTDGKMDR